MDYFIYREKDENEQVVYLGITRDLDLVTADFKHVSIDILHIDNKMAYYEIVANADWIPYYDIRLEHTFFVEEDELIERMCIKLKTLEYSVHEILLNRPEYKDIILEMVTDLSKGKNINKGHNHACLYLKEVYNMINDIHNRIIIILDSRASLSGLIFDKLIASEHKILKGIVNVSLPIFTATDK